MGFFGIGKRKDVLDLTERYKRQQEKMAELSPNSSDDKAGISSDSNASGGFGIFGSMASANSSTSSSSDSGYVDISGDSGGVDVEDKRRRLAKRIMAMTEKIEDLSNQIYHLQQRIEVLEKKSGPSRY